MVGVWGSWDLITSVVLTCDPVFWTGSICSLYEISRPVGRWRESKEIIGAKCCQVALVITC